MFVDLVGFSQGLSPWVGDGHLLAVSSYSSLCACVRITSSYKDTSQIELRPTATASVINIITPLRALSSSIVTF